MTSDVREFASFIAPLQADPATHVGMVGTDEAGIVKELEEFGTELFVERDGAGAIVGAAGFDYDGPLKRGYLYGPWSIEEGWTERADRLLERVLEVAPPATERLEFVFDKRNPQGAAFAEKHGFEFVRDHFTMGFARDDRVLGPDGDIRAMDDDDRIAVMDLHERCFEGTWPNGEQLLELLEKGPDRIIFVLYEKTHLAGYIYVSAERETGEAFIDNVGVDDRFRGRGFATRLLTHGLWWIFGLDEVKRIELSVRAENAAAVQVYEKAGFQRLRAIRQMSMALAKQT